MFTISNIFGHCYCVQIDIEVGILYLVEIEVDIMSRLNEEND